LTRIYLLKYFKCVFRDYISHKCLTLLRFVAKQLLNLPHGWDYILGSMK
jgi:hypothetical protein